MANTHTPLLGLLLKTKYFGCMSQICGKPGCLDVCKTFNLLTERYRRAPEIKPKTQQANVQVYIFGFLEGNQKKMGETQTDTWKSNPRPTTYKYLV